MKRLLIIGAGAAGSVVAQKCARVRSVFSHIHVASRTLAKCAALQKACDSPITISQVDADHIDELITLFNQVKPDLVVNMALPYQDLPIMQACLQSGVHYLDTANYEPKDEAKFCYKWQWDLHEDFKKKGLFAVLGCGFDPGVTNVFSAYALKTQFDAIAEIDIIDCNDGSHGKAFATNFNPEINIREVTQDGKYYDNGIWIEVPALSVSKEIDYPEVGLRKSYLIYHEELESLARYIPGVKTLRFWMTFSDTYITHLRVLQNVGMTRIDPIDYEGHAIVPLQFLKAVLPNPASLAKNYTGKTSIGCVIKGRKNDQEKTIVIYNVCHHEAANQDVKAQAVSFTTGVPAAIGAMLMATGEWSGKGVFNVEQLDPMPFMEKLPEYGLPWQLKQL